MDRPVPDRQVIKKVVFCSKKVGFIIRLSLDQMDVNVDKCWLIKHLMNMNGYVDTFLGLDKDMNGTLSKQELQGYADGTLTDIFIERGTYVSSLTGTVQHMTS